MKRKLFTIFVVLLTTTSLSAQKKKYSSNKKSQTSTKQESRTIDAIYDYWGKSTTDQFTGMVTKHNIYVMFNKKNLIIVSTGEDMNSLRDPKNWVYSGTYKIVGNEIRVHFTEPKDSYPIYQIQENGSIRMSDKVVVNFLTSDF